MHSKPSPTPIVLGLRSELRGLLDPGKQSNGNQKTLKYACHVQAYEDEGKRKQLEEMYKQWPFFKTTMDMMAMVLAKADDSTVQLYEAKLVEPALHEVGEKLRESFRKSRDAVLRITGSGSVLGKGACR